jgi:hypothetical protein
LRLSTEFVQSSAQAGKIGFARQPVIAVLQQGYHNIAALEPIAERELVCRGAASSQVRWSSRAGQRSTIGLYITRGWRSLSSKSPSRLECPSGSYIGGNVILPVAAIRLRLFYTGPEILQDNTST